MRLCRTVYSFMIWKIYFRFFFNLRGKGNKIIFNLHVRKHDWRCKIGDKWEQMWSLLITWTVYIKLKMSTISSTSISPGRGWKIRELINNHYRPDPSLSYIRNAQRSFSSGSPLLVISVAIMNSLKSMLPSPSLSNILNNCSRNCWPAAPSGMMDLNMVCIFSLSMRPSGQSSMKPWRSNSHSFLYVIIIVTQTNLMPVNNSIMIEMCVFRKIFYLRLG